MWSESFGIKGNWNYVLSASIGEMFGCFIRTPFEVIKQTTQAGIYKNSLSAGKAIYIVYNIINRMMVLEDYIMV